MLNNGQSLGIIVCKNREFISKLSSIIRLTLDLINWHYCLESAPCRSGNLDPRYCPSALLKYTETEIFWFYMVKSEVSK